MSLIRDIRGDVPIRFASSQCLPLARYNSSTNRQAEASRRPVASLHVEREVSPWGDESDVGGGKPVVPSGLVQVSSDVSGLNYLMGVSSLGAVGWGSGIGHGDVYDEVPPRRLGQAHHQVRPQLMLYYWARLDDRLSRDGSTWVCPPGSYTRL